jgi:hypothetical protein
VKKHVEDKCFDLIGMMFKKLGGQNAVQAFLDKKYPVFGN